MLDGGKGEFKCIIAKKFQIIPNQGNYDKAMLIDDAKTLYVSKSLINIGVLDNEITERIYSRRYISVFHGCIINDTFL